MLLPFVFPLLGSDPIIASSKLIEYSIQAIYYSSLSLIH